MRVDAVSTIRHRFQRVNIDRTVDVHSLPDGLRHLTEPLEMFADFMYLGDADLEDLLIPPF